MTDHLSVATRARYQDRSLAPGELLSVLDHLSACAACREAMAPPVAQVADALREAIRGEHLTYEQIEAHAERREDFSAHLLSCAECTAEVADLRREESRPDASWRTWLAAAALAIAILGSLLAVRVPQPPRVERTTPPPYSGTASSPSPNGPRRVPTPLPDELHGVLRQLAGGVLPSARIVSELRPSSERTRGGESGAATLTLFSPFGVIEEARPRFRWSARRGATYVAEVFDERYRSVARSESLRGDAWRPAKALPRGETYSWQITETRGETTRTAPEPPAPPARFRIIGRRAAAELEAAGTPLARGLLYAREGIVDRAIAELEAELEKVQGPSPEVTRALETLRRYQPAPTTTNPPQ